MLANGDPAAELPVKVKRSKSKAAKSANGEFTDSVLEPDALAVDTAKVKKSKSKSRSRKAKDGEQEDDAVMLAKAVEAVSLQQAAESSKKRSKSKAAPTDENGQPKIAPVPSSTSRSRKQSESSTAPVKPATSWAAAAGGSSASNGSNNNNSKCKPSPTSTLRATTPPTEPIDLPRDLDSETAAAILAALPKPSRRNRHAKKPPPPPRNRRYKLRLLDLPNDILHLLYDRLSPTDMITLATTSKTASRTVLPHLYFHARVCSIRSLRGLYFAVSKHPEAFGEAVRSIVVTRTFIDEAQIDLDTGLGEGIKIVPESGIPSSHGIKAFGSEFVRTLPMVWLAKVAELCPNIKGIDLSPASGGAFRPGLNLGFLDLANVLRERGAWFQPPESFPNNVVSSRLLVPGGKREHAGWKIRNVTLFDPVPFNPHFDVDLVRHGDVYETLPHINPNGASASWRGKRVTLWGDVVHNTFSTLTRFGLDKSVCRSVICRGDAFYSFDVNNPNAYGVLMRQTLAFVSSLRASPWRALNRLSAKPTVQFFRDAAVGMPNLVDLTLLTCHAPVNFVLAVVEPLIRRPRRPLRALTISRHADYSEEEEGEQGINPVSHWPLPTSPSSMTDGPLHDSVGVDTFWANNASQMPIITSLKSINLYGMAFAGTTLAHPIDDASFVPFFQVPATAVPLAAISFANLRTLAIDSVAIEHAVSTDWTAVDYDESLPRVPPAPGVLLADLLPTCPVLECLIIDQVMQFVKVLQKFPTLRMACFAITRLSKEHLRELYRRVYLPGPDGNVPFPNLMRLFVSNRDESEGAVQPTAAQIVAQGRPKSTLKKKGAAGKKHQVTAELDSDGMTTMMGSMLVVVGPWLSWTGLIPMMTCPPRLRKPRVRVRAAVTPISMPSRRRRSCRCQLPTKTKTSHERIELESVAAAAATVALNDPSVPMPPPPSYTGLFASGPGHARLRDVKFPVPVELTPVEMEEEFPVLDQELWEGDECMCGQRVVGVHKTVWIDPLDGATVCHRCCYWRQVRVAADPLRPVGPGFKKVIACAYPEDYIEFINMKAWMEVDLDL
ncbi:hypothetical protein BCR44DRAFT_1425764 [Catenaria anguillulae PL171]|uniref:F-box domain-containing protein n=1 Tax=Catenaria anguillulae PL171 TaxID=765915 RepID=A0A1Y2HZD2_9FUNG|nr:hypothetical protein BCR44DRAFT_1425764 [Catenaria anguillulae PL171]